MPSLDFTPAPFPAVCDALAALRRSPDLFADEELAELSAIGHELTRLAAHEYTQRLLARMRAGDGR